MYKSTTRNVVWENLKGTSNEQGAMIEQDQNAVAVANPQKIDVNGDELAIGHPLGATAFCGLLKGSWYVSWKNTKDYMKN
ncbi:hypothetical protein Tco_1466185 [Tanacetum coccineum]